MPMLWPTRYLTPEPDLEPDGWDFEEEYEPEPGPVEYDEHTVPQPVALPTTRGGTSWPDERTTCPSRPLSGRTEN